LFSSHYIVKLKKISVRLFHSSKRLEELVQLQKQENKIIEQKLIELQDLSSKNSPEIRRPIARIQAVLQMYDDLKESGLDPEDVTGISRKDEVFANIQEFSREGNKIRLN
jgi:uncharacterized protein (DUF4213/DUF364 family)